MLNEPRKLIMNLADKHAVYAGVDSMLRSRKPGQIIQALSKEEREILKDLKSDDVQNIRWP